MVSVFPKIRLWVERTRKKDGPDHMMGRATQSVQFYKCSEFEDEAVIAILYFIATVA